MKRRTSGRDVMPKPTEKTPMPEKEEIHAFLGIVERLSRFEAESRLIRGAGIFREEELPHPASVNVLAWLRSIAYD